MEIIKIIVGRANEPNQNHYMYVDRYVYLIFIE